MGGAPRRRVLAAWLTALSCLATLASGRRGQRIKTGFGGDGSYEYTDNITPAFTSDLCRERGNVYRGPYLQSSGPTRTVVRWSSDSRGVGVVCFGRSPGAMFEVAASPRGEDGGSDHEVVLEDLVPGTEYYYTTAVIDDATDLETRPSRDEARTHVLSPSQYHSFATFPQRGTLPEDPIRVWAIGDSGMGDYKARSVRDAFVNFTGGDWDLTLGLGDLAYSTGRYEEYQDKFFDHFREQNARIPVFTTPGNHDRPTSDLWSQTGPYFDLFTNPGDGKSGGVPSNHKSYYSFDYGPVHFVSVDSDRLGLEDDPGLYEWLEKDLSEARKLGRYKWIVAYHHQPPYSKGSHDSDAQYECFKLRTNLVPMFEKYGVDLVLAGHSHSYERSHLLNGHFGSSGEIRSNPTLIKATWARDGEGVDTLVKNGDGPHSGTVYIVTGSGARTSGGSLNHPVMARSQNSLGSLLLEFDPSGRSLDVIHVGSAPGEVLDRATIVKTPRGAWEEAWEEALGSGGDQVSFKEEGDEASVFAWEEVVKADEG